MIYNINTLNLRPDLFMSEQNPNHNSDQSLTDKEIELITDRIMVRLNIDSTSEFTIDQEWIKQKIIEEKETRNTRKRIIERIVGTVGAAGVLGLLGWIGHMIIIQFTQMSSKTSQILHDAIQVGGKS